MNTKEIKYRPDEDKVHVRHCCIIHGCKYGELDCPVSIGRLKQKYPCEWCMEDGIDINEFQDPLEPHKETVKNNAFLKGFLWACLIIILVHIGLAYVLL